MENFDIIFYTSKRIVLHVQDCNYLDILITIKFADFFFSRMVQPVQHTSINCTIFEEAEQFCTENSLSLNLGFFSVPVIQIPNAKLQNPFFQISATYNVLLIYSTLTPG